MEETNEEIAGRNAFTRSKMSMKREYGEPVYPPKGKSEAFMAGFHHHAGLYGFRLSGGGYVKPNETAPAPVYLNERNRPPT